ncbi:MAG: DNA polymerase III subunit gamma/tau, partial [Sphingobium sp.]
ALGYRQPLVTGQLVRDMLGLSDRTAIRRLLGLLLEGESALVLDAVRDMYRLGIDPVTLMRGLMELVHAITTTKASREPGSPAQSAEEREALADWAGQLGFGALQRMWQLLIKGHDEVSSAALPLETCEMALLRVIHAATMPDPGELARMLRDGGGAAPAAAGAPAQSGAAGPAAPASFDALIEAFWARGKGQLAQELHDCVGIIRYAPPEIDYRVAGRLPPDFPARFAQGLRELTGSGWRVQVGEGVAAPTRMEQEQQREAEARSAILDSPIVKAAMAAFPDAELTEDKPEQWSA